MRVAPVALVDTEPKLFDMEPPSKELPLQGPYGTGVSGPQFGDCPVDVEWKPVDKEQEYMTGLAMKSLSSSFRSHQSNSASSRRRMSAFSSSVVYETVTGRLNEAHLNDPVLLKLSDRQFWLSVADGGDTRAPTPAPTPMPGRTLVSLRWRLMARR